MGTKLNIKKRIEQAEKTLVSRKVPDMIWIDYDESTQKWRINERYFSENYQEKDKLLFLDHYKDYVIPTDFDGTILIDMMDCPEPFGLFSVNGSEIRKELKIGKMPFTIEHALASENGSLEHEFNITTISYAK